MGKEMKQFRMMAAMLGTVVALSACGGDDNVLDAANVLGLAAPQMYFENATPGNNTSYDLLVDGAALGGETAITYPVFTGFNDIKTGAHTIAFAQAGTTTALASGSFGDAAKGHNYTAIALGDTTGPAIGLIDDPFGSLPSNDRVRAFNASANAQNLDIYIVAPGTDVTASSVTPKLAGVAFKNAVPASGQDSTALADGTYVIVATLAGSKTPIFQSTQFSVSNNADVLLTTVPITGQSSPLQPGQIHVLLALKKQTDNKAASELINTLTNQ